MTTQERCSFHRFALNTQTFSIFQLEKSISLIGQSYVHYPASKIVKDPYELNCHFRAECPHPNNISSIAMSANDK